MKISIIIPNFEGEDCLPKAIASIKRQNYSGKIQIIVIDNASTDQSIKLVKEKFPEVKIISLPQNLGFASAFNLGLIYAEGDIIATGNNDAVYHPDCFQNIVQTFKSNKQIGLVGPKILGPKPSKKLAMAGIKTNPYLGYLNQPLKPGQEDKIQSATWLSGCALFIKKEVIEKIGSFDNSYFFYFEDTDFCLRTKKAGYKLIYNPKAKVWHSLGITSRKTFNQEKTALYWYQGKLRCILKNASLIQLFTSLLTQFLAIIYKNFVLKDKTLKPFLQTCLSICRSFPKRGEKK